MLELLLSMGTYCCDVSKMSGVGRITPWHEIPGWRMPPGTGTHIAFRFESEQRSCKGRQSDCLVTLSFSLPSIECPSHGGDSGWPNCEQHWRSDCECGVDRKEHGEW